MSDSSDKHDSELIEASAKFERMAGQIVAARDALAAQADAFQAALTGLASFREQTEAFIPVFRDLVSKATAALAHGETLLADAENILKVGPDLLSECNSCIGALTEEELSLRARAIMRRRQEES